MPERTRSLKLAALIGVALVVLIVGMDYFVLYNEGIRNEIIEFLLPVLENFLHQPEMDIVSIGRSFHA